MNIIHIIESLEIGGAEMMTVHLANKMASYHNVTICCIKNIGPLAERLSPQIPVTCLNKPEGNSFRTPLILAKLIRKGGYNVVHSHSWGAFFDVALAARLAGTKKIIHTAHGDFIHYPNSIIGASKKQLRRAMDNFASIFIDKIITVSKYIENSLKQYFFTRVSSQTIYNGINIINTKYTKPKSKKEIVYCTVGRLAPIKNYPMLIQAFHNAQKRTNIKLRLTFVGDGPVREELEAITTRLGLHSNIDFLGFQNNVGQILERSHVFILTSRYEGISVALLEAMAMRLPVIATAVGGNTEVILHNKTGILIPDNNIEACTAGILRLAQDDMLREKFGENGLQRVLQTFDIDATAKRYLAIYSK